MGWGPWASCLLATVAASTPGPTGGLQAGAPWGLGESHGHGHRKHKRSQGHCCGHGGGGSHGQDSTTTAAEAHKNAVSDVVSFSAAFVSPAH